MVRKFKLLTNSKIEPKAIVHTVVYGATRHDYGLARDDSRFTGVEHISVTLNSDGDYPFFTHPRHELIEIKE